jgi:hypothetical protein
VTDTESANSFTFDNGTVTLYGSGSPNLSIGEGGVLVNSTDGPTTFDSSRYRYIDGRPVVEQ